MNIRRVPIPEHPAELPEDDKRDDEARDGPDQDSERPDGRNDVIHAVALPCGWRIGKPHDRKTCGQRGNFRLHRNTPVSTLAGCPVTTDIMTASRTVSSPRKV